MNAPDAPSEVRPCKAARSSSAAETSRSDARPQLADETAEAVKSLNTCVRLKCCQEKASRLAFVKTHLFARRCETTLVLKLNLKN